MNLFAVPWKRANGKIISNPHFWVIVVIMVALTFVYYESIFFADERLYWVWRLEVFEFNYRMHGILFCIPLIYTSVIFGWRGTTINWLLNMIIVLPRILYFKPELVALVTNVTYLFIPLIIVAYISLELNWRNKEREALSEREAERQFLMLQIFKAQEEERRRLSRELHDDATQTLLVIATHAEVLGSHENVKNVPQSKEQAELIRKIALSTSEELRRISLDLRPSILDNLGLIPALRWLVNNLNDYGIEARIGIKGEYRKSSTDIDINLYRIAQEALSNVRRHSDATEAIVTFEFNGDVIKLKIEDNGHGFSTSKISGLNGKLGLMGIQQRVQSLRGKFILDSEIGKGTTLLIEVKV